MDNIFAPESKASAFSMSLKHDLSLGIVGNSFVFYNDLPRHIALIAASSPSPIQISSESVSIGGASLKNHSADPNVKTLLSKKTDFVILQDHSCVPGEADPGEFQDSLGLLESFFTPLLLTTGTTPILFSTWGHQEGATYEKYRPAYPDFLTMQKKLDIGYAQYYQLLKKHFPKVLICPVGEAFRIIHQECQDQTCPFPGLFPRLFVPDLFHPSKIGTYLAACCFFGLLTNQSPQEITWYPTESDIFPFDEKLKRNFSKKKYEPEILTQELAVYLRGVAQKALATRDAAL